jgi:hypothetical protein
MMSQPTRHSYLLRLWRDDASVSWHATLITVALPDEQHHFASLEALCAFLIAHGGPSSELERTYSTPEDAGCEASG